MAQLARYALLYGASYVVLTFVWEGGSMYSD